jgi:hypothetical protein
VSSNALVTAALSVLNWKVGDVVELYAEEQKLVVKEA